MEFHHGNAEGSSAGEAACPTPLAIHKTNVLPDTEADQDFSLLLVTIKLPNTRLERPLLKKMREGIGVDLMKRHVLLYHTARTEASTVTELRASALVLFRK